jgi:hypothetical protein
MSYGLGETGRAWMGAPEVAIGRLRIDRDLQRRVEAHLDQAELYAMDVLHANLGLLMEMAQTLSQGGALSGDFLRDFLDRVTGTASEKTEVLGSAATDRALPGSGRD